MRQAAVKGPWTVEIAKGSFAMRTANGSRLSQMYSGGPSISIVQREANARLAALAPALAREVLDQRRVGEELVGTQRSDATEIHGSRHASYSFDDCPTAFCVERRALIARWAELAETEVRAG